MPRVKPVRINFACGALGGAVDYANQLRWKVWKQERARGRGIYHRNTCNPNCIEGKVRHYRVFIRLRGVREERCGGRTVPLFQRAILRFPHRRPAHHRRLYRSLDCSRL